MNFTTIEQPQTHTQKETLIYLNPYVVSKSKLKISKGTPPEKLRKEITQSVYLVNSI